MPPEWMEELEHLIRLRRFVKIPGGYVNRGMILQIVRLLITLVGQVTGVHLGMPAAF